MAVIRFPSKSSRPRQGKYNAKRTIACSKCLAQFIKDGQCQSCRSREHITTFDSKAEFERYCELWMLRRAERISDLECQPRFVLNVNGHKIGTYTADFMYRDESGELVVEDVKGGKATDTQASKLRRKLVHAIYAVEVTVLRK